MSSREVSSCERFFTRDRDREAENSVTEKRSRSRERKPKGQLERGRETLRDTERTKKLDKLHADLRTATSFAKLRSKLRSRKKD